MKKPDLKPSEKRTRFIGIRFTPQEYKAIRRDASDAGYKRRKLSEYIRNNYFSRQANVLSDMRD